MPATIEWRPNGSGILRAGPDHHEIGDPFEFVAFVEPEGDTAFVQGGLGRGTRLENMRSERACYRALREAGFKATRRFQRVGNKLVEKIVRFNQGRPPGLDQGRSGPAGGGEAIGRYASARARS